MKRRPMGLNDVAWEQLFAKYDIARIIEADGRFRITADQIREFREPRLMAKFDHAINLPHVFTENRWAILPVSRGEYVIGPFRAYHAFEESASPVTLKRLPAHLQTLDTTGITSEAEALNCALASGIIHDFMEEDSPTVTVAGRMGSGNFSFDIESIIDKTLCRIEVTNAQIEIDVGYEGEQSLMLIEAKLSLADDFIVRQLYYPYRRWYGVLSKQVRPVFLVYSNGVYRLYEYAFRDPNNYSSLFLVRQKNYSLEDMAVSTDDIRRLLRSTPVTAEPRDVPFPQADSFERVINLCELLRVQELSREEVTANYAFDARQTNYYTDAARYLGLLEKFQDEAMPIYRLTNRGGQIFGLPYAQRQLELCRLILSRGAFRDTLQHRLDHGVMPETSEVVQIMRCAKLHNVGSESTFRRRASTVRSWVDWIVSLTATR